MRLVLASSFSNAFLGGLATWAFLTQGDFLVWAAVIAWGCFFHTGGAPRSVLRTIVGNSWGCLCAWTAGLLFSVGPASVPGPVWAGVVVFGVVIVMVFVGHQMAIHWKLTIAVVPACFYGAASTFAYMVQTPGRLSPHVLLGATVQNPLLVIPVSMAVGAFLGLATARMTEYLGIPSANKAAQA
jgi:Protein of unknown function (DUF1097)